MSDDFNGIIFSYFDDDGPKVDLPFKGSQDAAGYDIRSSQDVNIPTGCRALVPTNIKWDYVPRPELEAIKVSVYLRIAPRSGLAYRHGIDVYAGVVDADYRGHIQVILYNSGKEDVSFKTGERIAQLIPELRLSGKARYAQRIDSTTERGEAGFGSTGTQ
jgi:dUTP pyrophosphatase